MISFSLKCQLTDEILVNKQQLLPSLVNAAFQKLTKINPFYSNITTDYEWEDLIEQSDLVLWKFRTDKNARQSNNSDLTDRDDDIESIDKFKERELKESSSLFLTVKYDVDGPNICPSEIVNIAKFLLFQNLNTFPNKETTFMRKEKFQ